MSRFVITAVRAVFALVIALATGYFSFWIGVAIFGSVHLQYGLAIPLAVIAAVLTARFIWRQTGATQHGLGKSVLLGALLTGGIAFLAGFFGPILLMPDSPQGPLLGILIAGPLGFLVGGAAGAIYWFTRGRRTAVTAEQRSA